MPHCVIEYSKEIQSHVGYMFKGAFSGMLASNLFVEDDIKIRATAFDYYQIGNKAINDSNAIFIHIRISILSGRSVKQKKYLSHAVLSSISIEMGDVENISVEIVDMDSASYAKRISDC